MEFKRDINELTLIPSGGGAFEITIDGEKVYSKLDTGAFPNPDTIVKLVRERL